MVDLIINNQNITVSEGATILEAARSAGIYIPTLCYHPLIKPFGACRLCVVEISAGGNSRIATSCTYPVEEGLEVDTESPTVIEARKILIELLLARAPKAGVVQRFAREYGLKDTRLKIRDQDELCILCGLCARVCDEIIGVSAINFVERGVKKDVVFNPEISPELCVGCGLCTAVCPTGCLELGGSYGVISAIDMGRRAAISIDKYLGGEGIIEEKLIETEIPSQLIGRDEGFANLPREEPFLLLDGFTNEQALREAKRCLQCDLRLFMGCNPSPPEKWLAFTEENINQVPEAEGVFQLLDEEHNVLAIKGTANMRELLLEELEENENTAWFEFEEDKMFSKRESELIQQYLQEHGEMPGGGDSELDDLF